MTYAIRRDNGDVLYFDAITDFTETYTAQITKHPLASGALISDHTITENKKFSLKAVLSDADFNLNRPQDEGFRSVQDKQFTNNTETDITVSISTTGSKLRSFLPEVVSQFTASTIPTVTVTAQSKAKTAKAVRGDLIRMFEDKESFILIEYNTNLVARSWFNVSMVSLSFTENADSGEGLFPIMELEEAKYTNVQFTKIKLVPNKGRKVGEVTKTDTKPGDDAENEPTDNAKKTSTSKLTNITRAAGT